MLVGSEERSGRLLSFVQSELQALRIVETHPSNTGCFTTRSYVSSMILTTSFLLLPILLSRFLLNSSAGTSACNVNKVSFTATPLTVQKDSYTKHSLLHRVL